MIMQTELKTQKTLIKLRGLILVCTVKPGLSVKKLKIITVQDFFKLDKPLTSPVYLGRIRL